MIYLDNNATTQVDEAVLNEMLPYFNHKFGNAASAFHVFGWQVKDAIENSRATIAHFLSCTNQEIVFTSGATESINTAIKGVFSAYKTKGNHIVTVKTEHNAVLDTCAYLETKGASITYLDTDQNGQINLEELENAINENTVLVAIMYVNNETGIIHPIKEISEITHKKKAIFLCDATQAFGKININVDQLGIDLLAISGHKFYAPKGIGVLYIRRKNPRVTVEALLHGGKHERGWRSGTLNVPAIVALAKATNIAYQNLDEIQNRISILRENLESNLLDIFNHEIEIIGLHSHRIFNTSNIIFPIKSEKIIHHIKNKIAISTGSACTSAENKPSHVLKAMNYTTLQAQSAIRFSLGKYNTIDEIETVINVFKEIKDKFI
jgi:cysteine desulfurase